MTDAEHCAAVARQNTRTFSLAAGFLPRDKRRGAFAFYAFCRTADDIVDRGNPANVDAALKAIRAELDAALAGEPRGPVFRELAWAAGHFAVPAAPLFELLDGVSLDRTPARYESWNDLRAYCTRVASSVGEMCTHVFGVEDAACLPRAVGHGRTLGVAMQLTNILRDVGEDARRGHCYLPLVDLADFGFAPEDVLTNANLARSSRWRALMRFEIERARALYDNAEPGLTLLARDARQCATACARGYAAILGAIERQAYDTIRTRAVVPRWRKATLLLRAWRFRTA
ncbi:MAG TPA: phytoene/squalene synthase family protein [Gemmatimonadaceae bacterium]|nr:phytoene/squalene synthase family protein [Gemmatimonadaceae bacterium]